jgi:outer membrane receptor protein involved in Fe transport
MYNFYPKKLVQPPGCAPNILLIMKLTTLILVAAILQVSASTLRRRSLCLKRIRPLNKVFEKISDQTGYDFRATGSFSQPVKEEFEARVSKDVLSKLNGITSSLIFNANTTATKSGQLDINIRGRSTIFANDQPLLVVDNFPYSGNINDINPNDVESVTILKDAAAASIWGRPGGERGYRNHHQKGNT